MWFWHVLALALGKTIVELQQGMTQDEFMSWRSFFNQYPFDDFHRYHRPSGLIATSMSGADIDKLLAWLSPSLVKLPSADELTMKAFGF